MCGVQRLDMSLEHCSLRWNLKGKNGGLKSLGCVGGMHKGWFKE